MIHIGVSGWCLKLVLLCICDDGQGKVEHAHESVVISMVGCVVSQHVEHVFLQLVAVLTGEDWLVLSEADAAQRVVGASARETKPYITPWMVLVRYICGRGVRFDEKPLPFFK